MRASSEPSAGVRTLEGAFALAAAVPFAVVGLLGAVVCVSSLAGTGSRGEEGVTVMMGVVLAGLAVVACLLAAGATARRTGLSRSRAFCVAAFITIVWAVGASGLWGSGALLLVHGLPWPVTLAVVSGFTVPAAALGILGLIVVAVARRTGASAVPGEVATTGPARSESGGRPEKLGG